MFISSQLQNQTNVLKSKTHPAFLKHFDILFITDIFYFS